MNHADIDECLMNVCEHNCMNTIGSFECSCDDGFNQDGLNCTGITVHASICMRIILLYNG